MKPSVLIWSLIWYALALALGALLIGCGTVAEVSSDAGVDDAITDLDAAASDTQSTENQSDAAAVEDGRPSSPACSGDTAIIVSRCSSSCAICRWASWALPAPTGCRAPSGDLCTSDCSSCP